MKPIFLALVLFSFAGCASHSTAPAQIQTPAPFVYHLKGMPEKGSAEEKQDHDTLLKLQNTRTPAECARGVTEVKITLGSFYGPPYGPLNAKEVAALSESVNQLTQDVWPLIGDAKDHWARLRPYVTYLDLSPCAKKEPSFSYPSGHSAIAHYYMHVLTELFPDRKAAIEARADQIALDRTIVGIHFPTDIRDGKLLGDQIYDYLSKTPKYQALIHSAHEAQNVSHQ
jgi:acid phosphatase (class A)